MEPSFFLSYWRPWNEDSSLIDSWGDYLKDTSLVRYGTKQIGAYVQQATREQTRAIEEASQRQAQATMEAARLQAKASAKIAAVQVQAIQKAAEMIGWQLEDTKKELRFLNRRMDLVLEQQRMGLMLQNNIAELLKIPDSEKERQHTITLGIQFFVNASKDPDLYDDALEEFLKAETMKKQDYFVLHRIGCIYLFTQKHMDVQKALDYFTRAGKYAAVESSPSAVRLANLLTNPINEKYAKMTSNPGSIKLLAGDAYEKAALASYIQGDDDGAIDFQKKALSFNKAAENRIRLGKYLARKGKLSPAITQLDSAVNTQPELMNGVLCDMDLAEEPAVIDWVGKKVREADFALEECIDYLLNAESLDENLLSELYKGGKESYANKIRLVKTCIKDKR